MEGILINQHDNEFLAVIGDVKKFIKIVEGLDYHNCNNETWVKSYEMIKDLDDSIDDIDVHNKCSVCVSRWNSTEHYENDLFDICIYGDDGMLHFEIHTNPKTI
tara:strand:- start:175 stop:486 length:312 start_codon:yes stop_codon:yes gene_type:complete